MHLSEPLTSRLLKTTDVYIDTLHDAGIHTVEDFLMQLPRAYEDLSTMRTLDDIEEGEKVTLRGTVENIKLVRTRKKNMALVQAVFTDTEGNSCEVVWFNQPHIKRMLSDGADVVLSGKIGVRGKKLVLQSPTFEPGDRELIHAGKVVPIYTQHTILNTRWIREKIALLKSAIHEIPESLLDEVIKDEGLPSRAAMLMQLHFPESAEKLKAARDRLAFEELFNLQCKALQRKQEWQHEKQERLSIPMNTDLIKAFFASLKFTPTDSQRIAIYEILRDMEKTVPMSRLLEGDVGSGKTLVATAVIANAIHYGGQCALMVPTEVLAKQHAEGISKLFIDFHRFVSSPKIREVDRGKWIEENTDKKSHKNTILFPLSSFHSPVVALLTGSTPESEKNAVKLGLARGTIDIVVGTHALIQSDVRFKNLLLAIVDEQHRFGVLQRKALTTKGSPHFLSMTATPIPRTLALTAYGDHDLSVLLEKPGNRKPIKTKVVAPKDRRTVELFIDTEIDHGKQVYVLCPLIKESEELEDVKSVLNETERMKTVFPKRKIACLHGKLHWKEKDDIMLQFKNHKIDILVSTSVIEVGIDVPNASIILIEGAERFGLSQLHQLRGRVGRDDHQSHCFLCTTEQKQAYSERLKAMEKHNDGFMLAEIDLKLRGPGELYGIQQSGMPEIRAGSLTNPELVMRARAAAERVLGIEEDAKKRLMLTT